MNRRRYMGGTYGLLPTGINDLRTWKNLREDTLLDIIKQGNSSILKIKRLPLGTNSLEKEIKVKPNTLYKLSFDYEVISNYVLSRRSPFGLKISNEKEHKRRSISPLTYHSMGTTPEKKNMILYFYSESDTIILQIPLSNIKDDPTPIFKFGNFELQEESFPSYIPGEEVREVRVLASGDGAIMNVSLLSGERKDIPLLVGLNTINIPEEVQSLSFEKSKSDNVIWADLGNIRIKDTTQVFCNCSRLKQVYGINLLAGEDISKLFLFCKMLEKIPELDVSNITKPMVSTFGSCNSLKNVKIKNCGKKYKAKINLLFDISVESIKYLIENNGGGDKEVIVLLNFLIYDKLPTELIKKAKEKLITINRNI